MQRSPTFLTDMVRAILPRSLRNAIRRPGTSLHRLMSKWRRMLGKTAEVTVRPGWVVRCHPICLAEFGVFQTDLEQKQEMECFARLATPGMQFIDVGTHWGVFTLAALHFGGPEARVIGIEASDDAAHVYRDNLAINHVKERVQVINAACGEAEGQLKMLTTGAGGADYFVVPAEDRPDTIVVPQVSVDSVMAGHSFNPTHLKIDVEGFEEEVLRGAVHTLKDHHPVVFLELHGHLIRRRGMRPETVLDQLAANDYTRWEHLDGTLLSREELEQMDYNARFVALHT